MNQENSKKACTMEEIQPIAPIKKEKKNKMAKTGGTMFRNTMANHLQASALADRKASLMVSINTLIISVITSFLVHDYTSSQQFLLPACLLLGVSLSSITFAILATRPNVNPLHKNPNPDNMEEVDLLFFGDYTQLTIDNYKSAMKQVLTNDTILQDKMIENIYAQGKVLVKKYHRLKIAYSIFMYGFPLAIISFLYFILVNR